MKNFLWLFSFFLISILISCKDDSDNQVPTISITGPQENTEFPVLSQVVVEAQISDNEIVERVQVSLISDQTKNRVLPVVDIQVGQKEYPLDIAFEISDSLLKTGRYYIKVEAFDGQNSTSAFRYINIRGMNTERTGVFVMCEGSFTSDLYFDQNAFNFSRIHQFSSNYGASVFNRLNQQLWFVPQNGNRIEMFDPVKNAVDFSRVYNSNFTNPFESLKSYNRDVFFTVSDLGVKALNQNQNENYTYLTPATKKVESLGVGEQFNVVEEVDRNGTNRVLRVLSKSNGANLRSRTIFNDVVDLEFLDEENVLVFYNSTQGGGVMLFNAITSTLQTNIFNSDSIRQVVKTNVGDFVISTKSSIETFRPSTQNLTNYLTIREAVLDYDQVNNELYVGFGRQLRVYAYRQVSPLRSTTLPSKIVGINVKLNQF